MITRVGKVNSTFKQLGLTNVKKLFSFKNINNNKITKREFLCISNKTFFTNKSNPFNNDFNKSEGKNSKDKPDEWFEIEQPLIFQDGKCAILEATNSDQKFSKRLKNFLVGPIILFTGYKCVKSLILFRPVRTILWGVVCFFNVKIYKGLDVNQSHFLFNIDLLEDGKTIEIRGESIKSTVDIKDVRRLTPQESTYIMQMFPETPAAYLPIVIKGHFYLLFKGSKFHQPDIFKAISLGQYIKLKDDNYINKDEAIDIDGK